MDLTMVKQLISALLALILPFMGIGTIAPNTEKAPAPETVRIMSFNVRNVDYDRGKMVPQVIADYYPDSVGLQECEGTWFLTLKAYLRDYGIVGVGRLTGTPLIGESTAIMYRKDKYKVVEWDTFWLSETPDRVSKGWDAAYHRTCTWAVLENKETGERYVHLNTHLDNAGKEARIKGVELIIKKAEEFNLPTVITGDFNLPKDSDLYKKVIASNFKDVADIAPDADSGCTSHGYKDVIEGKPIDFIFVDEKITDVKSYKIVRDKYDGRFVSDHYPIYSDIKF